MKAGPAMSAKRKMIKLTLRLPVELKQSLEAAAMASDWSLNQEILVRLKEEDISVRLLRLEQRSGSNEI